MTCLIDLAGFAEPLRRYAVLVPELRPDIVCWDSGPEDCGRRKDPLLFGFIGIVPNVTLSLKHTIGPVL